MVLDHKTVAPCFVPLTRTVILSPATTVCIILLTLEPTKMLCSGDAMA